jgi:hypothetical protein
MKRDRRGLNAASPRFESQRMPTKVGGCKPDSSSIIVASRHPALTEGTDCVQNAASAAGPRTPFGSGVRTVSNHHDPGSGISNPRQPRWR